MERFPVLSPVPLLGRKAFQAQLNDLLISGAPLLEIADILGAGQYIEGTPEKGLRFNVQAFVTAQFGEETSDKESGVSQEDQRLPVRLPEKFLKLTSPILPPGDGQVEIGSGLGFEDKKVFPRNREFITLLTELQEPYQIISGTNTNRMMRGETYRIFLLSNRKKLIFINDEEGNATFVLHDASSDQWKTYAQLTKDQLKDFPESIVQVVNYPGSLSEWKAQMLEAITREGKAVQENQEPDAVEPPSVPSAISIETLPKTSNSELDPWKGFFSSEGGKHYGTLSAISERLGITSTYLTKRVESSDLVSKQIEVRGRTRDVYAFEDVERFLGAELAIPRVELDGEWRGFLKHNGEYYGPINRIADKLQVSRIFIQRLLKKNHNPSIEVRDAGNQIITVYNFESFHRELGERIGMPEAEAGGDWESFAIKDGQHYGGLKSLGIKLGLDPITLQKRLKGNLGEGILMKSKGKEIITGYSFEYIQGQLAEYLALPKVATEGTWEGFYEHEGKHYASFQQLSDRLGVSRSTVSKRARDYSLTPLTVRDARNIEQQAYALEDIEGFFSGITKLEKGTGLEQEWKGFQEVDGQHFAPIRTIARKLNAAPQTILKRTGNSLGDSIDLMSPSGVTKAYSYEYIKSKLGNYSELPLPLEIGEWQGFYEHEGKHYGSRASIAEKLNVPKHVVYNIKDATLPSIPMKINGHEITANSFEDVRALLHI